jgi:hypothetical protein
MLAKRKAEPAPDLAGEILRVRALIESYIDGKVAALKASRDGASIPVEQIRAMLTRNVMCGCAVALNLLADDE